MNKINTMIITGPDIKAKVKELAEKITKLAIEQTTVKIEVVGSGGYTQRHKGIVSLPIKNKGAFGMKKQNGTYEFIKLKDVELIETTNELYNLYDD